MFMKPQLENILMKLNIESNIQILTIENNQIIDFIGNTEMVDNYLLKNVTEKFCKLIKNINDYEIIDIEAIIENDCNHYKSISVLPICDNTFIIFYKTESIFSKTDMLLLKSSIYLIKKYGVWFFSIFFPENMSFNPIARLGVLNKLIIC